MSLTKDIGFHLYDEGIAKWMSCLKDIDLIVDSFSSKEKFTFSNNIDDIIKVQKCKIKVIMARSLTSEDYEKYQFITVFILYILKKIKGENEPILTSAEIYGENIPCFDIFINNNIDKMHEMFYR